MPLRILLWLVLKRIVEARFIDVAIGLLRVGWLFSQPILGSERTKEERLELYFSKNSGVVVGLFLAI